MCLSVLRNLWHDMDPILLVKQALCFYIAVVGIDTVVGIVSGHGMALIRVIETNLIRVT